MPSKVTNEELSSWGAALLKEQNTCIATPRSVPDIFSRKDQVVEDTKDLEGHSQSEQILTLTGPMIYFSMRQLHVFSWCQTQWPIPNMVHAENPKHTTMTINTNGTRGVGEMASLRTKMSKGMGQQKLLNLPQGPFLHCSSFLVTL